MFGISTTSSSPSFLSLGILTVHVHVHICDFIEYVMRGEVCLEVVLCFLISSFFGS